MAREPASQPPARGAPSDTAGRGAHPAASDSAARTLDAFLRAALETSRSRDPDPGNPCGPDGQNNYSLTLAAYRLLDVVPHAPDSATARAVTLSVALETDSATAGKQWHVIVGPRLDTLTWRLGRDSAGRWHVCGYALNGAGFGHWGADANTRFTPPGMNWRRIQSLADSAARHHDPEFRTPLPTR